MQFNFSFLNILFIMLAGSLYWLPGMADKPAIATLWTSSQQAVIGQQIPWVISIDPGNQVNAKLLSLEIIDGKNWQIIGQDYTLPKDVTQSQMLTLQVVPLTEGNLIPAVMIRVQSDVGELAQLIYAAQPVMVKPVSDLLSTSLLEHYQASNGDNLFPVSLLIQNQSPFPINYQFDPEFSSEIQELPVNTQLLPYQTKTTNLHLKLTGKDLTPQIAIKYQWQDDRKQNIEAVLFATGEPIVITGWGFSTVWSQIWEYLKIILSALVGAAMGFGSTIWVENLQMRRKKTVDWNRLSSLLIWGIEEIDFSARREEPITIEPLSSIIKSDNLYSFMDEKVVRPIFWKVYHGTVLYNHQLSSSNPRMQTTDLLNNAAELKKALSAIEQKIGSRK